MSRRRIFIDNLSEKKGKKEYVYRRLLIIDRK